MFPALSIEQSYIPYVRHPSRFKQVLVYAKIDGQNWYDISEYVKEVKIVNKLEFLETPAIDTATITLANLEGEWTPTQYNDTFDPSTGKFNGTVDQAYLSKEWEIKVLVRVYKDETNYINIPLFYGVKAQLVEKHREAQLKIADILYYATKKKLETDILYIDMKPNQILADLLQRAGYDSSMLDFQDVQYTCTFLARKDKTIWQAVIDLVRGTAGKISTSPEGKILYRTRMDANSYTDPDPALSLNQETFKRYDLGTELKYNKVTIESEGFRVDDSTSNVIDVQLEGEDRVIDAGKTGTFELEYISDYAIDVSDTIILSYETGYINADGSFVGTGVHEGISFTVSDPDPQPSNEHIQIVRCERYAEKVVLEIKNLLSDGAVAIDKVTISGRQVKKVAVNKVVRENTTDQPDKEYSVKSFFDSQAPLENIADVIYDDINKTARFGLAMNEFYPDVFAGNLIEFSIPLKGIASGTFLVLKVEHALQGARFQTSIDIVEWKGLEYAVGDKTYTRATRGPQPIDQQISNIRGQIQEIQDQVQQVDDRTSYIDGSAPSVPQNLTLSTTTNEKGESVVRASWDAVPEADVIGYEVAWSLDGVHWRNTTTADTITEFVVPGNVTVYVKVRALDAEGKKSAWSTAAQITSAKDTTPPATPTGLTATGLFQTIMVRWNKNTEEDFDHYVLEYDTNPNFSNPVRITLSGTSVVLKELTVNTTYYIRVKAVDRSGNESEWSEAVSASTVKIDDENYYDYAAIKDAIIHNGKIDSAWISELDAGLIKTGTLDADRIAAGSITFEKLAFRGAMSLPEGAIAYWIDSLVDVVNGITPEGYTEPNLHPSVTLLPENAPEGSVVADLLAADKVYGNHIAANTITADKINVSTLSAITANAGTITAGVLKSTDGLLKIDLTNKSLSAPVLTFSVDKSLGIVGKVNSTSKWGGAFMGQWYGKVSSWNSAWVDPPSFNYPFLFPTYLWFFVNYFAGWVFHFWWYIPNSKLKKTHIRVRVDAHDDESAVLIKNVSSGSVSTLLNLSGSDYNHYHEASTGLSTNNDYILLAKLYNYTGQACLWFGFSLY